ncbi:MAG: PBP1b-binding outer membrane lipoprotein LpoB [Polaribacter sp.]|jgi:PBP1b-binding outer membrane lipoprotein LpoB
MKKIVKITLICFLALSMTGCATLLGGPVTQYQKTKPAPGQPQREVRVLALIADIILFLPGTIVDFATGAIYRPKQ